MKKKFLGLTIGLVAALPMFVNADEVSSETFNECMTATGTKTCQLTENIEIASSVEVKGNITLDLAGYQITSSATTAIKVVSGSLNVKDTSNDSKGKIEVSGEAFRMGTKGVADNNKDTAVLTIEKGVDIISTNDSCVVIYAGTLNTAGNLATMNGHFATITGSGNEHGTVINVTDGLVSNATQVAIYQPQNGTTTIDGGTITGTSGVEVRAGKLTVNGGTITSIIKNDAEVTVSPNGSGSTTSGVGIAVAQHTTLNPIEVVVNGGTVKGLVALYESNPQKNSATDIKKIKITVKGGTLETTKEGNEVVFSENNLITVEAGEFSGELPEDLTTPEDSKVYEVEVEKENGETETKYVVATEEKVENLPYETEVPVTVEELKEELEELKKELEKVNEEELSGADLKEYQAVKKMVTILDGKNIVSLHNINYGSFIDGNYVVDSDQSELKEAVKVILTLPTNLPKVKEGYVRKYSVLRSHMNTNQEFEYTELEAIEKDGKVTFETDKFSSYILMYEDVKDTTNPNTFDGISLYMIIASVSLVGLVSLVLFAKKAKNY